MRPQSAEMEITQLKARLQHLESLEPLPPVQSDLLVRVRADSITSCGQRLTTVEIHTPHLLGITITFDCAQLVQSEGMYLNPQTLWETARDQAYVPTQDRAALAAWSRWYTQTLRWTKSYLQTNWANPWVFHALKPFAWNRILCTSSDWNEVVRQAMKACDSVSFIQRLAVQLRNALEASTPTPLRVGQWHTPYVSCTQPDWSLEDHLNVCVSRCLRMSDTPFSLQEELEFLQAKALSGDSHYWKHCARCESSEESRCDEIQDVYRGWRTYESYLGAGDLKRVADWDTWCRF